MTELSNHIHMFFYLSVSLGFFVYIIEKIRISIEKCNEVVDLHEKMRTSLNIDILNPDFCQETLDMYQYILDLETICGIGEQND